MAQEIPLANGRGVALVDDDDFVLVCRFSWSLSGDGRYAQAWMDVDGVRLKVLMHRFIMDAPKGVEVDHDNRCGLDCRRSNLRFATPRQNRVNRVMTPGNESGFHGVSWFRPRRKWRARINVNNRRFTIGYFDDPKDAARAYDARSREVNGRFGRFNFPLPGENSALQPLKPQPRPVLPQPARPLLRRVATK